MSTEKEPATWSLEEHMRQGREAVAAIALEGAHEVTQPLCHHFSEAVPVDPMTVSVADTYSPLEPVFEAQGLEFLSDRLEAWEDCKPTLDWLEARIRMLMHISSANGLIYEGWTWEQRNRQPLGACTFRVINNRTRV